jgi:hypothetical protein
MPQETDMAKSIIGCGCETRRRNSDYVAEELAERWHIPKDDPVWLEYTYWRDYLEKKNSRQKPAQD